jgi:hypothetical protein
MRFYLDDGGTIEAEVINGVWPDTGPGKIQDVQSFERLAFHILSLPGIIDEFGKIVTPVKTRENSLPRLLARPS